MILTKKVPLKLFKKNGFDGFGAPAWQQMPDEFCAVVKLFQRSQHTTVRADAGGSRGHADEFTSDSVLLVGADTRIEINDKILVGGLTLKVIEIQQRYSVLSRLDHYEIRCSEWV